MSLQEIPFRHIWNGTQNGLHCSFALEHVDRSETQLTCNIRVCQSELSANQQIIHVNRNVAQVLLTTVLFLTAWNCTEYFRDVIFNYCSYSLGRLFDRVDLIKWVGLKCPSVCPSVHTSFFDFNKIWRIGRGRCVMNDCVQYDPIQGQGYEPFRVGNPPIFKSYLLRHLQCELATGH